MNLKESITSIVLILLIILGIAFAIWTVIPDPSATKVSPLGYLSHCPIAPYSTAISIAVAIVALILVYLLHLRKIPVYLPWLIVIIATVAVIVGLYLYNPSWFTG